MLKYNSKRIIFMSAFIVTVLTGCNTQPTPTPQPAPQQQAPQQSVQTPTAPTTTSSTSGADVYTNHCAGCHGVNATGGSAPKLTADEWRNSQKVQDYIKRGKPEKGMPAYASTLNNDQIKAVGDYIASLKK